MQKVLALPQWLGVGQVAVVLEVSPRHVRRLAAAKKIESTLLHGVLLLDSESVYRYKQARGPFNRYGVRGGKAAAERLGVL